MATSCLQTVTSASRGVTEPSVWMRMMTSGTFGWPTRINRGVSFLNSGGMWRGGLPTLVCRQHDMGRHLEVDAEQVAQGVIFLKEEEVGAVRHAWWRMGLLDFGERC